MCVARSHAASCICSKVSVGATPAQQGLPVPEAWMQMSHINGYTGQQLFCQAVKNVTQLAHLAFLTCYMLSVAGPYQPEAFKLVKSANVCNHGSSHAVDELQVNRHIVGPFGA